MDDRDTPDANQQPSAAPSSPLARAVAWIPWSRQTLLFGVAVSVFVHAALLLWAALLVFPDTTASATSGDGDIPLAVVAQNDLQEGLRASLSESVPTLEALAEPELGSPEAGGPLNADAGELEMTDVGDVGGAGDPGSIGGSDVFGGGAEFFGVEARGSRFAYILDVSGSMTGPRIDALRDALGASIDGLLEHAKFVVVAYNGAAIPLFEGDWLRASDSAKRAALTRFNRIDPNGGTNPVPAFDFVFNTRPRPDAIYFMTDGQFESVSAPLLQLLDAENRGGGRLVPVHCITLVERSAEGTMREIARRTGGTYTHIPGGGANP